jgi:hypothetical protein
MEDEGMKARVLAKKMGPGDRGHWILEDLAQKSREWSKIFGEFANRLAVNGG